jgi:hypothetical protein
MPDLNITGRVRQFAGFLDQIEREASATPAQRWLSDNAAAISRAHADMLAEREMEGTSL